MSNDDGIPTVTINVDPEKPENNGEVFIYKADLDAIEEQGTTYKGYVILLPADNRFMYAEGDTNQYTGEYYEGTNLVHLKVPAMPFFLARDTGAIGSAGMGPDAQAAVIQAMNDFGADNDRHWKRIILKFPEGHKLGAKAVGGAGPGRQLEARWLMLDPVEFSEKPYLVGTHHFVMFKVCRHEAPLAYPFPNSSD